MNKKYAPLVALGIIALSILVATLLERTPEPPTPSTPLNAPMPLANAPIDLPKNDRMTVPTSEPYYSQADFETFTQKFRNELPPMAELRRQPKHSMHPGLVEAYARSGKIARAAIRQPELRETAFAVLEYCANLPKYDSSIKAMCLRQHRKIRSASGDQSFDERNRFKNLRELDNLLHRSFDD